METKNMPGRRENWVLNSNTFKQVAVVESKMAMTVRGTVGKTTILLTIVAASAAWGWLSVSSAGGFARIFAWLMLAMLAALIVGLVTSANMQAATYTAPLYAFLEGSVLGVISAIFEAEYPGLAIQAVFLTFGTLLGLLAVYSFSGFRVTARFRAGILSAMLAILLVYAANFVLRLLGMEGFLFIHQYDLIGIGFSLFVVAIAALNLVLDFDLIENGARDGAPRYMEWYAAFGLMVTLIWLYLEILELLARIAASSDDN